MGLEETQSSVCKLVVQGQQHPHLPGACQMQTLQPAPDLLVRICILAQSPGNWCANLSLISSPTLQLRLGTVLPSFLLTGMLSWTLAVSQLKEARPTQSWGLVGLTRHAGPSLGSNIVGIPHSRQDSLPLRIFPFPHLVSKGDFGGEKGIHPLGQCFEAFTNTLHHCFP